METKSSSHRFVSLVVRSIKVEYHPQCTDLVRGRCRSSQTSVCLCKIEVCVSQKIPATVTTVPHTGVDSRGSGLDAAAQGRHSH